MIPLVYDVLIACVAVMLVLWATVTPPALYWYLGVWIAGSLWYWYTVNE